MRKFILFGIFLLFSAQYGLDYLLSKDFQKYADSTKAPWTCYVNATFGNFYMTLSRYDRAMEFYGPISSRCPKTSVAESADFKIATCLENLARRQDAYAAYAQFVERYPKSKRARIATRAMEIIETN